MRAGVEPEAEAILYCGLSHPDSSSSKKADGRQSEPREDAALTPVGRLAGRSRQQWTADRTGPRAGLRRQRHQWRQPGRAAVRKFG